MATHWVASARGQRDLTGRRHHPGGYGLPADSLVSALTSEYSSGLAATLPAVFPWARSLPPHELKACARELREAFNAESAEMVDQVITGWQATADIYADPALTEALRAPVADPGPVPEPFHG